MSDARRTVYDPPLDVIVIGYVWQSGNGSGGTQEVFLSQHDAERRLEALLADGKIKEPDKLTVHRLGEREWLPVDIRWPEALRLGEPG